MRKSILIISALLIACTMQASVTIKKHLPQTDYAATLLRDVDAKIVIDVAGKGEAEGFTLKSDGEKVFIIGNDAVGCIYGANRLKEYYMTNGNTKITTPIVEVPQMKMRGTCLGMQKTTYLPGHKVYEYPYTPENFPWFYDKAMWVRYLDILAADNFNAVYLWNGHPFASLVKLKDYPFAPEVDDATMKKNQEMFSFITQEASRRGIMVIQMFYNIIVSKPFADHYGISTQDRHRPITPLVSDYTRKSIAAFISEYPNVGLLICLGEAMDGIDTDIEWMTKTIIPGIRDGLKASGRTDEPPIILRSHDTDGPRVLAASLPLYKNIYTMSKYTGESLTTYEPRGPWAETHRQLATAAPLHISNVHILANLEPWRWSSPAFVEKTIRAMKEVHHAGGLHLYPQASYWDWPYSADNVNGSRLLQMERDWMWYATWGRYAWGNTSEESDRMFWLKTLAEYYGCSTDAASQILTAYDESGEIAPKLIRRFGITEGNRQTLLLGMKMTELVNPYKYTIYPGFYESCGPEGEKLIEYVEKEAKGERHTGELPLIIAQECVTHGEKAVAAIDDAEKSITRNRDEFMRLKNDMHCYREFAVSFNYKVKAAAEVLDFKWTNNLYSLFLADTLLEKSNESWKRLVNLTQDTYLYANSMQTSQRRIPVGGDGGHFKTWAEMLPVYEGELQALRKNITKLSNGGDDLNNTTILPRAMRAEPLELTTNQGTHDLMVKLEKGAKLFEGRDETVEEIATELTGLRALMLNRDVVRTKGLKVSFSSIGDVNMLVGFFVDDQNKFASPPKLETDASGNEYGQAEPILTNAIAISGMPRVNIHCYHFKAGHHEVTLPKGIIMVAGFTTSTIKPRDAKISSADKEMDWLFM